MSTVLLVLLPLLAPQAGVRRATETWRPEFAMTIPRHSMGTATLGGRVHVIRGSQHPGAPGVESFDFAGGWQLEGEIPGTGFLFGVVPISWEAETLNGTLYAVSQGYLISLDPDGGWSPGSSAPASEHGALAASGGELFAIGGASCAIECEAESSVHAYDTATGIWSPRAPLVSARSSLAAVGVGGKVYAIGGAMTLTGGTNVPTATLQVYDPVSDVWTTRAPMHLARWAHAAVAYRGRIYVLGGHDGAQHLDEVEVYDPATDLWTVRAPLATPRSNLGAAVLGGRILAIGGDAPLGPSFEVVNAVESVRPLL
jgi:hypothetical protein